ncbi:MAG: hypothetical protein RMK29_11795 [Myxococcales bacterium]|nr:ATP-binding protein [Myxococcota bacterium]MDW8282391.1 hypothetical protein [Myxococcales bacterium]
MFIERLVAGLSTPQNRLGKLDDALVVDIDQFRALLMRQARTLSEAGEQERAVAAWALTCIAEGWVDDHLHTVRDSLIELGAVADQAHLDRLLRAATLRILGIQEPLPAADDLLLETVTRPAPPAGTVDAEPLGLRLLVRHYALELGLLSRASGTTERTPLGETALRLPRHSLPAYLLALEMLQSAGPADRWRTPRRALAFMLRSGEFDVPTSAQLRRQMDPEGLVPWRRVRRLALMGLCEAVEAANEAGERCRYRLLPAGQEVLQQVLREPASDIVRLAQALLAEQTRQALRPLLVRTRATDALRAARESLLRTKASEGPARAQTLRPAMAPAEPGPLPRPATSQGAPDSLAGEAAAPCPAPPEPPIDDLLPIEVAPPGDPLPNGPMEPPAPSRETELPQPPWGAPPRSERTPVVEHAPPLPAEPPAAEPSQPELELGLLVQRAWDEIQARQVRFALQGPVLRISADRRALLQALRELLRSAADAAQLAPTPSVLVELMETEEEAVLLVHDNGPPLSPADRDGVLDTSSGLLTEGPRAGLVRAHRVLRSQGLGLQLPHARLGGTTVRVAVPRARGVRRAAA